ncbi:MAG: DinB family protein [Adhaeribacter sp.]
MLTKNQPGQYPEYFDRYVSQLPNNTNVFEILAAQPQQLSALLTNMSEENAEKGYAPGKWSIKEVIGHLIDADRVFAYRCLCISRREHQSLPSFDENTYVEYGNFNSRSLSNLLEEFSLARQSHLALFNSLDEEMLNQMGVASNKPIMAKALIVITAGHALHHLKILEERYLNKLLPA